MSGVRGWLAISAVGGFIATAVLTGFNFAANQDDQFSSRDIPVFQADLKQQRTELEAMRAEANEQIDALALRMAQLNANVIRLNALGSRLTGIADLDKGEFDFLNPPAVGGPVDQLDYVDDPAGQLPELLANVDALESTLQEQEQQLFALEGLLMDQKLRERVNPKGRPVKTGWLSSYYGKRTDPITGKAGWHKGVDFAGKHGNDVIAVGDGVVSWSDDRFGYGNLVEIKHGNGFVTRYAHNQENLVAVGDQVNQGQTIALMGSTGRSTGPHVHFEVWHNGRPVDPARYIKSQ
ncbi:MAG: peptidoglycan DD-metalloendopeptidase family protein [Gammaproteobacteria bacterium]